MNHKLAYRDILSDEQLMRLDQKRMMAHRGYGPKGYGTRGAGMQNMGQDSASQL